MLLYFYAMQKTIEDLYDIFLKSAGVETDTRKIKSGSMFFCLKGENFNANEFAAEALEKGAVAVVADELHFEDERIIQVDSVLEVMQKLANFHRRHFDIPVIGITGTNGKTTTKELIYTALSAKFRVHATAGNFNNHIGVPLTLLSMPGDTEIAVVEMGANHKHEIGELCRIAEPDYGIITNIGKAHLEGFGSIQGVIETKKELYDFVAEREGHLFVDASNDLLMDLSAGIKRSTYGAVEKADFQGRIVASEPFISLEFQGEILNTKLLGNYNFTNIMAAIAIGSYFDVDKKSMLKALSNYSPSNKRSQFLDTGRNKIYLDAYNANPTSMRNALESFRDINIPGKVAVLGDMLELGKESPKEHLEIIRLLKELDIEDVILVGAEFSKVNNGEFNAFVDTDEASRFLKEKAKKGKFILLKGSRGIGLEKLLPYL